MNKVILISASILMIALTSCNQNPIENAKSNTLAIAHSVDTKIDTKSAAAPIMTFEKKDHDFGTINEGEVVKHLFSFTNTGNAPLVIVNAKGSCGCTVTNWPKEPIAPGASETFLVSFNSSGKPNLQNKKVTITANTKAGKEILKIKAMVTPKIKKQQIN